jgi:hypothetical protein
MEEPAKTGCGPMLGKGKVGALQQAQAGAGFPSENHEQKFGKGVDMPHALMTFCPSIFAGFLAQW